jgi:hypothetical protein
MRKLLVKIGKDFGNDKWGIVFGSTTETLAFHCIEGFPQTVPFPGTIIEEDGIKQMITFLQKTLQEKEENEQSIME